MRSRANSRKSADTAASMLSSGTPAVFLDRDGTICEEVGYVNHLDRIQLYPWSAKAIRKLNRAGFPVIVVTNQSGVGRGYFSEKLVRQAHARIARELAESGAHLDAFYYCPHHPTAVVEAYRKDCLCRKPATGMLDEAARRFNVDLKSSFVVGDSYRDMQLAFASGAHSIMLMTGYGKGEYAHHRKQWPRRPERIAANLWEAAEMILNGRTRNAKRARKPRKSPQ
ncbi:MAG TPA: HAD family hydrolase [Terriglobia bacterium]|nr:HAD family hydrolase [Terriglobia bacterium]